MPLHYCCRYNKPDCIKLFLRSKVNTDITNEAGETALDVARQMGHDRCQEVLLQAQNNQFNMRVHVEYEWWLGQEDMFESDDDLDEKLSPVKNEHVRPQSFYHPPSTASQQMGNAGGFTKGASQGAQGKCYDVYAIPHPHSHGLDVPPLAPRSVPRAPSFPPPPPPNPPVSALDTPPWKILPRSLTFRHKRTSSEPVPWVPSGPTNLGADSGPISHSGCCPPEGASPRSMSAGSPEITCHPRVLDTWQQAAMKGAGTLGKPSQSKGERALLPPSLPEPAQDVPPPLPRRRSQSQLHLRRVRALYDCQADREDELTFSIGEVIIVAGEEDCNWWRGWIEGQPHRRGAFPESFVHMLN
uniref:SH3 domain-containing protein n=1 Tax=Sphenodon punctatus TaxID=8508 RepID=A0A8D0H7T9_SPHPU